MCATCGCGDESHVKMTVHGEETLIYHSHEGHGWHLHTHDEGHDHHHGHTHHHHSNGTVITLEQNVLHANDMMAQRNRGYFEALGIRAINLVSSPGSGKTTILERSLEKFGDDLNVVVIEGDQQTSNDADRIAKFGVPVLQINTGKMCHLDAEMIHEALHQLNPPQGSTLFIENVGNLVCPAMFDLGETRRVVIMSVTEGTDKAIKYPEMFHTSDLCIINKTDLLPYVDFNVARARELALQVNDRLEFIEMSATTGEGLDKWRAWLEKLPVQ